MKKLFFIPHVLFFISITFLVTACKKDEEAEGIDKELLDLASSTSGFTWYKNSASFLPKSSASAHPFSYLRTRYNAIASAALDSNGKVIDSTLFPEGSLVVKELSNSIGGLDRYAILLKRTGSPHADSKGWVWGYINKDKSVAEPASKKGASCSGCHAQTGNIDYMLMNIAHP
ncbi:MAG: cytochrome P460 family protein [Sphingobacteriales bacterium]|nr:cytochrome P460 family protein [Sphingobacteriales bacterium]